MGTVRILAVIDEAQLQTTVLHPAAVLATEAVNQADMFLQIGELPSKEKQSLDCELVTPEHADEFGVPRLSTFVIQ